AVSIPQDFRRLQSPDCLPAPEGKRRFIPLAVLSAYTGDANNSADGLSIKAPLKCLGCAPANRRYHMDAPALPVRPQPVLAVVVIDPHGNGHVYVLRKIRRTYRTKFR